MNALKNILHTIVWIFQNWPGGFVTNSGIVIGIISGCRFDTEHSNEVFLRIIPINGRITPEDDVLIEI